jgi:hypothetical protein
MMIAASRGNSSDVAVAAVLAGPMDELALNCLMT